MFGPQGAATRSNGVGIWYTAPQYALDDTYTPTPPQALRSGRPFGPKTGIDRRALRVIPSPGNALWKSLINERRWARKSTPQITTWPRGAGSTHSPAGVSTTADVLGVGPALGDPEELNRAFYFIHRDSSCNFWVVCQRRKTKKAATCCSHCTSLQLVFLHVEGIPPCFGYLLYNLYCLFVHLEPFDPDGRLQRSQQNQLM